MSLVDDTGVKPDSEASSRNVSLVDDTGVKPDSEKVHAIQAMKPSSNVS